MVRETAQLWLDDTADSDAAQTRLREHLNALSLPRFNLGLNGEHSVGAGHLTLDIETAEAWSASDWQRLPGVRRVDHSRYRPLQTGSRIGADQAGPIWRTLLLRVRASIQPALVVSLEQELLQMPAYMPGILRWSLSRVEVSDAGWTHVWQQEFRDADALFGEYMLHPYHWAWVDRRFDPDFPEWTVESELCHVYCPLETSLLT